MDNPATVAEVIRRHGAAYIQGHPPSPATRRLMALLPLCRTAALGGHLHRCTDCGYEQPRYNSCGNRHCPNCQVLARERWLAQQERALLDLPYFHMVFTLPQCLQPLLLQNQEAGYTLLFQTVASSLQSFGSDPRHGFEGQLGFTSVLHTWNQTLGAHAHLHVLLPAGTLACPPQEEWTFRRAPSRKWIFPVRALSTVFRARFMKGLRRLWKNGRLEYYGNLRPLQATEAWQSLEDQAFAKDWVVYAKRPFGGPKAVLAYLGRYTHRVAISNARILEVNDHTVRFLYRDPNDAAKKKVMELSGPEFLRRFFLHVLPTGFTRIRHYGFLGTSVREKRLPLIRSLIGQSEPPEQNTSPQQRLEQQTGIRLCACPHCKTGELRPVKLLPRVHDPPT